MRETLFDCRAGTENLVPDGPTPWDHAPKATVARMRYRIERRILVTGNAGLLGSYLCEGWCPKGHDVIGADNTGWPTSLACSATRASSWRATTSPHLYVGVDRISNPVPGFARRPPARLPG